MVKLNFASGLRSLNVVVKYFQYGMWSSAPNSENGRSFNGNSCADNDDAVIQRKWRKSRPGDLCPICLNSMTEDDMRFLICEHAMHNMCYRECRQVRKYCTICNKKYAELSEAGDECVICFDEMTKDNMEYMKCEHAMHGSCLRKYREKGNHICPLCRRYI